MEPIADWKQDESSRAAFEKLVKLVPKFGASDVELKDPISVLRKVETIVGGSLKELQVIADFDYTMSRYHMNGKPCYNCFKVVQDSDRFPNHLREKFKQLYSKYYPIEICHELTAEEKIPHLIDWFMEGFYIFRDMELDMATIQYMVRAAEVELRCGTKEMLRFLSKNDVPLLVFSAGLGDVIEEILKIQKCLTPNVHLISNRFKFDELGKVVGLKGEVIHSYNKNEASASHSSYFEDLTHRPNVMLMGDSIGDAHMADGVVDPNVVLRIGFLNDKVELRLPSFAETFDVVLLDDQTMELPKQILHAAAIAHHIDP